MTGSDAELMTTIDHRTIRRWVERRDGEPAAVPDDAQNEAGVLRIRFPDDDGDSEVDAPDVEAAVPEDDGTVDTDGGADEHDGGASDGADEETDDGADGETNGGADDAEQTVETLDWETFFERFEGQELALVYREESADGSDDADPTDADDASLSRWYELEDRVFVGEF